MTYVLNMIQICPNKFKCKNLLSKNNSLWKFFQLTKKYVYIQWFLYNEFNDPFYNLLLLFSIELCIQPKIPL